VTLAATARRRTARVPAVAVAAALVATAPLLSGIDGPQPARPGLTRSDADEIVRVHNAWRARVGVLPLVWSAQLAARAQSWAEQLAASGCRIEHRGNLQVGENLFRAAALRAEGRQPALNQIAAAQVVHAWGAESADYSYGKNTCAAGRACGHYTQIVWSATRQIGCGMAVCPDLGQIWVCHYWPAGNVEGRRPY
jgi:pathogenesis-related protein 1